MPFGGVAVHAQGGLHGRDRAAPRLAGADRRRQRRRGHRGRARRRQLDGGGGDDVDHSRAACRSTPTPPPTSARACSWRATSTSTCTRARRRRPRCPRARRCRPRRPAGRSSSTACCRRCTPTARANLQTLLQGLGPSLNGKPTAGPGRHPGPERQRGLTAGQSLNQSLKYAAGAFKASAIVNPALLGSAAARPLRARWRAPRRSSRALASAVRTACQDLVTTVQRHDGRAGRPPAGPGDDDRAAAAAAARRRQRARPAAGLVRADPAVRRAILTPSVKQTGPTITAGLPWLAQSAALLSPQELGGLLDVPDPGDPGDIEHADLVQGAAATARTRWPAASCTRSSRPATSGSPIRR